MSVRQTGILTDAVSESSGIACSWFIKGVCYTHNDSQHKPEIFAIDTTGKLLATISIKNARARDWEDISIVGKTIYIGDVGDNRAYKKTKVIYRIQEPEISLYDSGKELSVTAENFTFELPQEEGGQNVESMFVDPATKAVYMISKKPDKGETAVSKGKMLYKIVPNAWGTTTAELVGVVGSKAGYRLRGKATGADISPDGKMIAVRTYTHVYMWMTNGELPEKVLLGRPCASLRHKEKQSEAIGFSADSTRMYTTSEGISLPMWEVLIQAP